MPYNTGKKMKKTATEVYEYRAQIEGYKREMAAWNKAIEQMKIKDEFEDSLSREEMARRDNPGLQELWDQYQTMLQLCLSKYPKRVSGDESIDEMLKKITDTV